MEDKESGCAVEESRFLDLSGVTQKKDPARGGGLTGPIGGGNEGKEETSFRLTYASSKHDANDQKSCRKNSDDMGFHP
ncbi:MAG: hypothetical protein WHT06_05650 [Desulfobacterales bacterium]